MTTSPPGKRRLPLANDNGGASPPIVEEADPDQVDVVDASASWPTAPDRDELRDRKHRNYARYLRSLRAGDAMAENSPLEVFFEVANSCNFSCRFCAITVKSPRPKGPSSIMQRHVMEALGPRLPELATVSLHGFGEPFLNRHLEALAGACGGHGAHVEFFTNGSMLRGKRADALLDGNVSRIVVSISSADPELYARLYKGGDLSRLSEGLRRVADGKRQRGVERPVVSFNTILMKSTVPGLPELVRFAAEHGVSSIECKPLVVYEGIEGMHDERVTYDPKRDNAALQSAQTRANEAGIELGIGPYLETARDAEVEPWQGVKLDETVSLPLLAPCPLVFRTMYVRVNGEVKPCCFASGADELSLGNVTTDSFDDIWNGPRYRALREQHLRLEAPKTCEHCVKFNLAPRTDSSAAWLSENGFPAADPAILTTVLDRLAKTSCSLGDLTGAPAPTQAWMMDVLRSIKALGAEVLELMRCFGLLRHWLPGLASTAPMVMEFEGRSRAASAACLAAAKRGGAVAMAAEAVELTALLGEPLSRLRDELERVVKAALASRAGEACAPPVSQAG